MVEQKEEQVKCVECGAFSTVTVGHLTEEGKHNFRCSVCKDTVLEVKVVDRLSDGRKLLID